MPGHVHYRRSISWNTFFHSINSMQFENNIFLRKYDGRMRIRVELYDHERCKTGCLRLDDRPDARYSSGRSTTSTGLRRGTHDECSISFIVIALHLPIDQSIVQHDSPLPHD